MNLLSFHALVLLGLLASFASVDAVIGSTEIGGTEIGGTEISGTEISGTSLCSPLPACSNGGAVIKHIFSSACACACPSGYEGDLCELETPCSSFPSLAIAQACQSGGAVTGTLVSGCGCDCRGTGRGGERCELDELLSPLSASTLRKLAATTDDGLPCLNGGECTCPSGYQGERCETATPCSDFSSTFSFACLNNGTLDGNLAESCGCDCSGTGYQGTNCQTCQKEGVAPLSDGASVVAGSLNWAMSRSCDNTWNAANADEYGAIACWNTSLVTSGANLMSNCASARNFNEDLALWDVSSMTDTSRMFYNAREFDSDLSCWNVGQVVDFTRMFTDCRTFNSDLSRWETGNVKSFEAVFEGASSFESDLSMWNTSSGEIMDFMFTGASLFNSDLTAWDVRRRSV